MPQMTPSSRNLITSIDDFVMLLLVVVVVFLFSDIGAWT
jgi:hypothetical protein